MSSGTRDPCSPFVRDPGFLGWRASDRNIYHLDWAFIRSFWDIMMECYIFVCRISEDHGLIFAVRIRATRGDDLGII